MSMLLYTYYKAYNVSHDLFWPVGRLSNLKKCKTLDVSKDEKSNHLVAWD